MGEVTAEHVKAITDEANADAKKISDKYKDAPSNGAAEANKVLQAEINDFHNRGNTTPEERKLYVQALTKKLEDGDDGNGTNALLPKISEAWLADPNSTIMTKKGLSEDSINQRLEHNNERIDEGSQSADIAMLQNAMLGDIKKKYFAEGSDGENVSADTVKSDVGSDESQRAEKVKADTSTNQDWDAAKALLANNGKLFNTLDQMNGGGADGYISYNDVKTFVEQADSPLSNSVKDFSKEEIEAVRRLKTRWDNDYQMDGSGNKINIGKIMYSGPFKNYITKDSLAQGLGKPTEELTAKLGAVKYGEDPYADPTKPAAKPVESQVPNPNVKIDPANPEHVLSANYANNVTRTFEYAGADGALSKISDDDGKGTKHVYTVGSEGKLLDDQGNDTGYKDAAVDKTGKFTFKTADGTIVPDEALSADKTVTQAPAPEVANPNVAIDPANPEHVLSAKYANGITRTFEYSATGLSKISDEDGKGTKHVYTVNSDGKLLDEQGNDTGHKDATVDKTGKFTFKTADGTVVPEEALKPTETVPQKTEAPEVHPNLHYDADQPKQLNSAKYADGLTRNFKYDGGNLSEIKVVDKTGKERVFTVKDGVVSENGKETGVTEAKVDQATGKFTFKNGKEPGGFDVAPSYSELPQPKQNEIKNNVIAKLKVGEGQGYWQVADQVLRLNGNKNPNAAEVRELTEILKKSNLDSSGKPKKVLKQNEVLLATESKEFKDLLNRMAS
jgi:hypothetical protein